MSTNDHQQHDQEPLPAGARAALRQRGERLLSELESMRQDESAAGSLSLEPLAPQAELALRRRGDELLAQLELQRADLESVEASAPGESQTCQRRNWRPWAGVAAALVALAAAVQMAIPLASPPPATSATSATSAAPAASDPAPGSAVGQWSTQLPLSPPSIPEPNSALLTLFSAVVWLSRRRR